MIFEIFGLFGVVLVVYAAVTKLTTLAAITQMGSIQERSMPWASLSRPRAESAEGSKLSTPKSENKVAESSPLGPPPLAEQDEAKAVSDALRHVLTKDKVVYTLGVVNVAFTAFFWGRYPEHFYLWHSPKMVLYIAHRWYTFRQQNQHYLLYDFCYWANALSLLYCWLVPTNSLVFQILFVCSNGPLAWSVLAFSQSLIFHSAPHMTSVFIHTSPMLLTFAIRWFLPIDEHGAFQVVSFDSPEHGDPLNVSPWSLVGNAVFYFYGWWVVLYYVWVYVIMGTRIKKRGYKTLFDRVVSRGPTKFITKVSHRDLVQKAAYMITHFVFALFTMALTAVYWRNFWIHLLFVVAIVSVSAWNASGFYFTVFLAKYEEELRMRVGLAVPAEKKEKVN